MAEVEEVVRREKSPTELNIENGCAVFSGIGVGPTIEVTVLPEAGGTDELINALTSVKKTGRFLDEAEVVDCAFKICELVRNFISVKKTGIGFRELVVITSVWNRGLLMALAVADVPSIERTAR